MSGNAQTTLFYAKNAGQSSLNGIEAGAAAELLEPDAVGLDLSLPVRDGFSAFSWPRIYSLANHTAPGGFSPEVIRGVVQQADSQYGLAEVTPHDVRRYAVFRTMQKGCEHHRSGVALAVSTTVHAA